MSLTKVSYSMITGAPINVLDRGADPTGVADSTSAIQSALNDGYEIYFPKGTYKVTTLTFPAHQVILQGDGQKNTIISGSGSVVLSCVDLNSRFSQINDMAIVASPGATAIRIRNLGTHLNNMEARGGYIGINLVNSVLSHWNLVTSYGSRYGVVVSPDDANDVVWLCTFNGVSTSGNSYADQAIGFYVDWGTPNTIGFMRYCTFNQLDAEQIETGIMLLNSSAINNVFQNSWVEYCSFQYIREDDGCANTWINTQRTPAGVAPSQPIKFSSQSLLFEGTAIQPVVNGGTRVGISQQDSANVFRPIGPQMLAKELVAASAGLYASNQTTKATGYYDDFYVVEKAFNFGSTTSSTAIIQVEFTDNPAGTVEVELGDYRSTAAGSGGVLKYRRAVVDNGTTGVTFATIDTDYKNSYSDITFTSVSRTKFNLVYTWATSQPDRIGVVVRASCLAGQGGATGVKITALI